MAIGERPVSPGRESYSLWMVTDLATSLALPSNNTYNFKTCTLPAVYKFDDSKTLCSISHFWSYHPGGSGGSSPTARWCGLHEVHGQPVHALRGSRAGTAARSSAPMRIDPIRPPAPSIPALWRTSPDEGRQAEPAVPTPGLGRRPGPLGRRVPVRDRPVRRDRVQGTRGPPAAGTSTGDRSCPTTGSGKAYSLELEQYMTSRQELTPRSCSVRTPTIDGPGPPALVLQRPSGDRGVPALSVGVAEGDRRGPPAHFRTRSWSWPPGREGPGPDADQDQGRSRGRRRRARPVSRYPARTELGGRVLEQVMHSLPPSKLKDAARARLDQEFEGGLTARREKAEEAVARRVLGKPLDLEFKDAVNGTREVSLAALKGGRSSSSTSGPRRVRPLRRRDAQDEGPLLAAIQGPGRRDSSGSTSTRHGARGGPPKKRRNTSRRTRSPWPQHYDWKGWSITLLVQKFGDPGASRPSSLIDAEGKVASLKVRGQLETLIPEQLAKAKNKVAANAR